MAGYPRQARGLFSGEIAALESKVSSSLALGSCMVALLGVESTEEGLDYSRLWAGLEGEVRDGEVRGSLREGLAECEQTVQCLHQARPATGISQELLAKSLDFLKCFEAKKTEACVKRNIKRKLIEKLR